MALHPISKATLSIPLIRNEIEANGKLYGYQLLSQRRKTVPSMVAQKFALVDQAPLLHVVALHEADGKPYVLENRWINDKIMSHSEDVSFAELSANEWLLQNIPFTHGDIDFSAKNASQREAALLGTKPNAALFVISRTTWDHDKAVTMVELLFHAGHRKRTQL